MSAAAKIHEALTAAGIPIDGVSVGPTGLRIDFRTEATAQQRLQAQAIAAGVDIVPRKPADRAAVRQAIAALSAADRQRLMIETTVDWLIDHPQAARKLGIAVDGDEPTANSARV